MTTETISEGHTDDPGVTQEIDLCLLRPHGKVLIDDLDGLFTMTVTRTNTIGQCKPWIRCTNFVEVPGTYHLPLRIDLRAAIDVPSLYVLLGEGHVDFGVHSDNRRLDDICDPQYKLCSFHDQIKLNEFNDITLIYDRKEMAVQVNGSTCYHSTRENYMKSKRFAEMNAAGFSLKIACEKHTKLQIQSLRITEYRVSTGFQESVIVEEAPLQPLSGKPTLDSCIAPLPLPVREAVEQMDCWLKALRPMKFKRVIDKNGTKITYIASEQGLSYALHLAGDRLYHTVQWYILTQGNPETWKRKADGMEETLNFLAETDPAFAHQMWQHLRECVGGYGAGCLARTPYTFDYEKIVACHGRMYFNMNVCEFDAVKRFIGAVNHLTEIKQVELDT